MADVLDQNETVVVNPLSVTANGTYEADEGEAYSPVTVNVPNGGLVDTVTTLDTGGDFHQITGTAITGTVDIRANGVFNVAQYENANVNVTDEGPTLQTKTGIAPTESSQTIVADAGYDGLSSVQIDPVSSTYVGSGINRRSATDLSSSGATVTVPEGYYAAQQTKSIDAGTAGTPSVTVTPLGEHSVEATPSVTNTAGYINSGTKTGEPVTITASDLVSGNKVITTNGVNIDVSEYSTVTVNVVREPIEKGESTFSFNGVSCTDFELFLYNDQSMSKSFNYKEISEEFVGDKWRPYFYGTKFKNKFTFTLNFGLSMARLDAGEYLTLTEINNVSRWLGGHSEYKVLEFDDPYMKIDFIPDASISDDSAEDAKSYSVWCRCMLKGLQLQRNGDKPFGFTADFDCDSAYGYITLESKTIPISAETITASFDNQSCHNGYYFPKITYASSGALGSLAIVNLSDNNRPFTISDIDSSIRSVVIDSEKCVITNDKGLNLYEKCNFIFPKFINGVNNLRISGATGSTLTIERVFPVELMN